MLALDFDRAVMALVARHEEARRAQEIKLLAAAVAAAMWKGTEGWFAEEESPAPPPLPAAQINRRPGTVGYKAASADAERG